MNNNSHATLILVDDEVMVTTTIKGYLQLETDYTIQAFNDSEEADRFLGKQPADVVVSDYMMPRMNGIQLLARARQSQPEASRVLLTGHADAQSAITAINEVGLFQYLEKPWENAQLLLVIRAGVERSKLLRQLREKVGELDAVHSSLKDVQRRLLQAFL
jgi:response regulator RpfG family c-di-GMP phosphodiesterase